jgi:Ca2+:H+ antiporter
MADVQPLARADSHSRPAVRDPWWREWPLVLAVGTLLVALLRGEWIAAALGNHLLLIGWLVVLSGVILAAAVAIARHADVLAHRLGEPYGTLLLTLAITGLEVAVVSFVMTTGEPKPTLARDTMYAVVMLVMNGCLGLALLLGGWRHREQSFNLQSANAFLIMIVPLTVLGLIMPDYTYATPGPVLAPFQMVFLSLMSGVIYIIFLLVQNRWHRSYFTAPAESCGTDASDNGEPPPDSNHSSTYHALMLALYGAPLVLLAKQIAKPLDATVTKLGAPLALSGMITALLVLTPECITAIRAALANHLQRAVNVLLGSVLASIGLTIPLVICVALATHQQLVLGLDAESTLMLLTTLVTSMLTFSLPRTNVLLGCVHLQLFAAYFMLLFDR